MVRIVAETPAVSDERGDGVSQLHAGDEKRIAGRESDAAQNGAMPALEIEEVRTIAEDGERSRRRCVPRGSGSRLSQSHPALAPVTVRICPPDVSQWR